MPAPVTPIEETIEALVHAVAPLRFGPPVAYVYNPLEYAGEGFRRYARRFGRPPKEILLLGMNPGPWGMAQTGVPFGEVAAVAGWMGIEAPVAAPPAVHPKKPVDGFACPEKRGQRPEALGMGKGAVRRPRRLFFALFRHQLLSAHVPGCGGGKPDAR